MKQKFSTKWKSSKQPRKQRKYIANAPLHLKRKMLSSNLSKELRKKHNRRSMSIRKEDTVKVMRGKFKGKKGKITSVDLKKNRVAIENLQITKKDGTKVNVYFQTSNLQIQDLNLDDKKRLKIINRNKPEQKKEVRKEEKKEVKEPENKTEKK